MSLVVSTLMDPPGLRSAAADEFGETSNASCPCSSDCLRLPNDTNSWTNKQLCVLIDRTSIKHTARIELFGCAVSSRIHQKFRSYQTAWEGHSVQGHTFSMGICWTDNHLLFICIGRHFSEAEPREASVEKYVETSPKYNYFRLHLLRRVLAFFLTRIRHEVQLDLHWLHTPVVQRVWSRTS